MNKLTTDFLTEYKTLESNIRSELGISVLDYENKLTEAGKTTEAEKLKVCRIIRNYLSHNDTDFIVPTKDMINFVYDLANKIASMNGTAKDRMLTLAKYGSVKRTDSIIDACAVMGKKQITEMPIINPDGTLYGIATSTDIFTAISSVPQPKKCTIFKLLLTTNWETVDIDTPVKSIPENKTLLVIDKKGKVKGVIC